MSHKIPFKIRRFDPLKDKKTYFQEYIVDVEMYDTVLDGLIKIRNETDSTLAFRMSCKSGICGSCAMRINGRARLACKTKIEDIYKNFSEIKIEPLGNLNVIKDLVVDMNTFYAEMEKTEPWLKKSNPIGKYENKIPPKENIKMEKSGECVWCGACFSDCPSREAENSYMGPAAGVMAHRFIFDPRDKDKENRLKNVVDNNIWLCAHCEKATENCPQKIDPQDLISQIREESIKYGLTKHLGARHVLAINKSIKTYGEISESRLPVWTLGPFGVIKEIKTAYRLIIKRKFPPLKLKRIHDFEDIKKLYLKNPDAGN
ncbi:succinate dehydrogenase/fumarate reductase iron-sulfur subunit [Candidatus Peregrinibacteria bacterium]|nr:succinate dehydrogenase/fumarate reductase iron-sulfur subunit [Candidatus Peregrinibacteria bacterium]